VVLYPLNIEHFYDIGLDILNDNKFNYVIEDLKKYQIPGKYTDMAHFLIDDPSLGSTLDAWLLRRT
jgi:endonuclease IV